MALARGRQRGGKDHRRGAASSLESTPLFSVSGAVSRRLLLLSDPRNRGCGGGDSARG
jgi:hypothetical protein